MTVTTRIRRRFKPSWATVRHRTNVYLTDIFDKPFFPGHAIFVPHGRPRGEERVLGCEPAACLMMSVSRLRRPCTLRAWSADNNLIEQDHRSVKQRIAVMLGLKRFQNAGTIADIELMHRIRKGQFRLGRLGGGRCKSPPAPAPKQSATAEVSRVRGFR